MIFLTVITNLFFQIDLPRALRAGFSIVDIELEDDQQVIVSFPSYYEKLQAVLENADKRLISCECCWF